MKRFLAFALALLLCLSLFGCQSQPGQSSVGSADNESSAPQAGSSTEGSNEASSWPSEAPEVSSEPQEPSSQVSPAESMPEDDTVIRVAALKGPTAMGLAQLMTADTNLYEWTLAAAADEITPKLVQGELDIAAVPANLASVLYNNTEGKVQVLAVNTLGVLYLVENGDAIHSVEDLRGKTIYSAGKGATPEYALNYMLTQNGLDPESDVTIEWKSEHAECVSALAADATGVAMLPQPFVTTAQMKNESIRVCLDLNEEWERVAYTSDAPGTLITGVAVVRTAFAEEHPGAVTRFLHAYQGSVDFVNANTDDAAAMIGQLEIVPEPVAKKALPQCNITFIAGEEMKEKLSGYLQTLFDQNPKAVGGKLPDDDFYYLG